MAFDIPRNRMVRIEALDVTLDPAPHPFQIAHAEAIEENFRREVSANPALFDGRVALLSELALRGQRLVGRCHIVRFATFLYWRSSRLPDAEHVFAHAALVSSDGALVAIRMGPRTANAGRVYFASGSFEPVDFRDGQVDLHFNMQREVREETGLDLDGAVPDAECHLFSENGATAIYRRYRIDRPAQAIADDIARFVAQETDPEIEAPVIIRDAHDLPEGLMPHMAPMVRWHFSGAR